MLAADAVHSPADASDMSELELQDLIDTAINEDDLERALHPNPQVHTSSSQSSPDEEKNICWGSILQRDAGRCQPGFVAKSGHFKNKLCQNCRAHGLKVKSSRVATIPSEVPSISNGSEAGLWNDYKDDAKYRVINHTAKCVGPRLAIFYDDAPNLGGPPMLDGWSRDGWMHLVLSKGTLVPRAFMMPFGNSVVVAPNAGARDLQHREKRGRTTEDGDDGTHTHAETCVRDPCVVVGSVSSTSGTAIASSAGPPSLTQLLSMHEQLLQGIHATLSAAEPAAAAEEGQRLPELEEEPKAALSALVGPLCRSMAALERQPLAMQRGSRPGEQDMVARPQSLVMASRPREIAAAVSTVGENGLSDGMSIPPSPPGTGNTGSLASRATCPSRSSTRLASPLAKSGLTTPIGHAPLVEEEEEAMSRSSGLFACTEEPVSCLTVLLCCPTILAQLWVRRGLKSSTVIQRRGVCLLTACILWLGIFLFARPTIAGTIQACTYFMRHVSQPPMLVPPSKEEAQWSNASAWCTQVLDRADEWHDLHELCNSTFDAALVVQNIPMVVGTLLIRNGTKLQKFVSVARAEGEDQGLSGFSQTFFIHWNRLRSWIAVALASVFLFTCAVIILCSARGQREAHKHGRARGVRGAVLDCCVTAWCLPCVLCQLTRHEGLTAGNYRIFASDGRGADILPIES